MLLPASRATTPDGLLPTRVGIPLSVGIAAVAFVLSMGPEPSIFGRRLPEGVSGRPGVGGGRTMLAEVNA